MDKYLEEKKAKAKEMFLDLVPDKKILSDLTLNRSTFYGWINKEEWRDLREQKKEKVNNETFQEAVRKEVKKNTEIMNGLEQIRKKSITPIEKNELRPEKFKDAADVFITTIKAEKEFREDFLKGIFITEIVKILNEEIQDNELFYRIGTRLQSLASTGRGWKQNNLLKSPEEPTQQ